MRKCDRVMQTFAAHGDYAIKRWGHVARVDAWGPWNTERTLEYAKQLRSCCEAMPKPFALLAVSHVQPILGPDAEAILRLNVRQRVLLGCVAQATVLLDPATTGVAHAQYRHIYVAEGLRHAFFESIDSATQWLLDMGFAEVQHLCADTSRQSELPDVAMVGVHPER